MPRAVQVRVVLAGLARVGRPALLDGQPAGYGHVERDADLAQGSYDTVYDNHVLRVNIVTLAASFDPRTGQTVQIEDEGTFKLDRLLKDSGVTRKFVGIVMP